jgi:outer membrane lipoprotein-sorting protein
VKRVGAVAGAAALAASLSLASAGANGEPADGLVFDAMSAPATVSYAGTVQEVRVGNERSEASVYRIEHRAPNLTQRLYLSPSSLHGDSVVTRGEESFAIDVHRRRVVETKNGATNDQIARDGNYILLRANYRAVKKAPESLDGRDVITVALVNNYTHATTMLVRIDQATKLVLDKQTFASDGSLVGEVRFEDVRFTPAIPDSDFHVPAQYPLVRGASFGQPSDDVAGAVRNAGFDAVEPKALPNGFSAVEGHVVAIERVTTLHILYSDGIRTVSLFENAGSAGPDLGRLRPQTIAISGHDVQYAEEGSTTLLTWNQGAVHCTLVGEVSLDELKRIAASFAS